MARDTEKWETSEGLDHLFNVKGMKPKDQTNAKDSSLGKRTGLADAQYRRMEKNPIIDYETENKGTKTSFGKPIRQYDVGANYDAKTPKGAKLESKGTIDNGYISDYDGYEPGRRQRINDKIAEYRRNKANEAKAIANVNTDSMMHATFGDAAKKPANRFKLGALKQKEERDRALTNKPNHDVMPFTDHEKEIMNEQVGGTDESKFDFDETTSEQYYNNRKGLENAELRKYLGKVNKWDQEKKYKKISTPKEDEEEKKKEKEAKDQLAKDAKKADKVRSKSYSPMNHYDESSFYRNSSKYVPLDAREQLKYNMSAYAANRDKRKLGEKGLTVDDTKYNSDGIKPTNDEDNASMEEYLKATTMSKQDIDDRVKAVRAKKEFEENIGKETRDFLYHVVDEGLLGDEDKEALENGRSVKLYDTTVDPKTNRMVNKEIGMITPEQYNNFIKGAIARQEIAAQILPAVRKDLEKKGISPEDAIGDAANKILEMIDSGKAPELSPEDEDEYESEMEGAPGEEQSYLNKLRAAGKYEALRKQYANGSSGGMGEDANISKISSNYKDVEEAKAHGLRGLDIIFGDKEGRYGIGDYAKDSRTYQMAKLGNVAKRDKDGNIVRDKDGKAIWIPASEVPGGQEQVDKERRKLLDRINEYERKYNSVVNRLSLDYGNDDDDGDSNANLGDTISDDTQMPQGDDGVYNLPLLTYRAILSDYKDFKKKYGNDTKSIMDDLEDAYGKKAGKILEDALNYNGGSHKVDHDLSKAKKAYRLHKDLDEKVLKKISMLPNPPEEPDKAIMEMAYEDRMTPGEIANYFKTNNGLYKPTEKQVKNLLTKLTKVIQGRTSDEKEEYGEWEDLANKYGEIEN